MDNNSHPKNFRTATAVFFFNSGFGYAAWASRIPTIKHNLHLNEAELGALLFALPVGLMATMPFTSFLLSRYSSRKITLWGAAFFNIMLALVGLAATPWQLALVLFGFGSSRNMYNLSINAQAVSVQRLYTRSIITTFHGIWSFAGFAGAALGYLMVSLNIATTWHLPAVGVAMLLLAFYFYTNTFDDQPIKTTQKKPVFSLPDKHLLTFAIIAFASMACENTMYDWSGIYFIKGLGASQRMATAGFVFYMVAMTIGRFAGDKLVDRFGIEKILSYSGTLITAGLLISVLIPYTIAASIGFILTGFGVSCIIPLVFSLAGKSKTMSSATALASISTVGYIGFLVVPPMIGFVAQAAGIRAAFGIIAALGVLILWMVSLIKPAKAGVM
ncbi:MFS transporter [Mucilaginibacter sp. RS28]|uniref:MFS transporter n=1 Tax=Mucilaginibacter straminoryzae TaxID=2932774 RepID=A0A9X2B8C7_9SPHI|nr:MFS transporter [Mucilaginibacter straminoryzae]MCJ8209489.1 MFS transporter [Mucilaginibacter straminoryzae]